MTTVASAARVHKEEWSLSGIPFFRSSDVVSAYKGTDNNKVFISSELYLQLTSVSGELEKDDILITEYSEPGNQVIPDMGASIPTERTMVPG